jgi:outer membrane protein assembly factor BamB
LIAFDIMLTVALGGLSSCGVKAEESHRHLGALVGSPELGWPQWRGPRRDGISRETGLLASWPEAGPPVLWTASGLGKGFSSPIVANGSIYLTGDVGGDCRLFALSLDGTQRWHSTNGRAWTTNHQGARSSCTYADGRLYHMNAHGRVACFDPATGKELWAVETLERFDGKENEWGLAESVLVDGGRVFVTPGGKKGFMAALDAKTGETVWASEPMPDPDDERTGYSSPIMVRFGGRRLLVNLSEKSVVCVDAATGKQLWRYLHPTKYDASCATSVFWNDHIFHANPSGAGCVMLRMRPEGDGVGVKPIWEGPLDNISGGAVIVDGFVYGAAHNNYKGRNIWMCLDAGTGGVKWESTELVQGSLLYADGRLYCLAEDGTMALVNATPERFEIVGQFRFVDAKRDAWAHPVVLDGRLYLRYHEELRCYDVRAK